MQNLKNFGRTVKSWMRAENSGTRSSAELSGAGVSPVSGGSSQPPGTLRQRGDSVSAGGGHNTRGGLKSAESQGTADDENKADSVPSMFCCPICYEAMSDPVVLVTGHTYDRECITRWIGNGHKTCPVTGVRLRHLELMPNFALRNAVREWAETNGVTLRPVKEPTASTTYMEVETSEAFVTDDVPETIPAQQILQGHDEIVWAMEVSGRHLFSASADKTIRVWDTMALRCVTVLEDHTRPVLSLAVTDTHLYSGSYDCTIRVWELETLTRVAVLEGHTDAVRALVVAGGKLFSGSYDNTVRVWDLASLERPAGGQVRNTASLCVLVGHTGPVRTLAATCGRVFSGSYDRTVCVWDVEGLVCIGTLAGHTEAVRALAAGGDLVFSGSDDTCVRVWNALSLECLRVLRGHQDNVRVLAVGNGFLYSGSWDKTVHVWNLQTLDLHKVLHGHTEAVLALSVARGHLVSGSYDMTVQFWDINTLRCVRKCEGHQDAVRVLTAAGDTYEQVFSGSYDGSIGCWKVPDHPPR